MQAAAQAGVTPMLESLVTPRIALLRTGIGLLQGLVLYVLYLVADNNVWPATAPLLFSPLLLASLFCPVILVSGLGHLTRRQLLQWVLLAAALIAALAVYDIWRMGAQANVERGSRVAMPSTAFCFVLAAGMFIAHVLVLSGARDRRRIATYATHFEIGWKLGVQLAFSGLFVGIAWAALMLGAQLFKLVNIDFLDDLVREPWFAIPATAFAFSSALHLTDVRPAIVQGIRSLLLVLASWILPVLTVIVGGFLASLPFTGLAPLWATRQAAAVLLLTDAALVILINAAWQNGAAAIARPIRLSARAAALLLAPVTAIAIYALTLRVGDHGWTDERIIAAACMLVASCYALGYAAAALRKGWLDLLAPVNTATAFVVLATLLLLFSPLVDPARVSVNSQLARLESGKIAADKFDFAYLRFDGKRFGSAALDRLEAEAQGPDAATVRARIAKVRKMNGPWERDVPPPPAVIAGHLRAKPDGTRLPESFLRSSWADLPPHVYRPDCLVEAGKSCDVYQLDVDADGKPEMLVTDPLSGWSIVARESADGKWSVIAMARIDSTGCGAASPAPGGDVPRAVTPALADVEFAGKRFKLEPVIEPYTPCPMMLEGEPLRPAPPPAPWPDSRPPAAPAAPPR